MPRAVDGGLRQVSDGNDLVGARDRPHLLPDDPPDLAADVRVDLVEDEGLGSLGVWMFGCLSGEVVLLPRREFGDRGIGLDLLLDVGRDDARAAASSSFGIARSMMTMSGCVVRACATASLPLFA